MLKTVRAMLGAVHMPQILVGSDERVLAANEGAGRLFGKGLEGRHYVTVLRQPAILDCIERVLRDREAALALFAGREGTRETTWQISAGPVDLPAGCGALITFEDKTAMEEAGQIRRDFVANVSHELRTPLTALIGFMETLRGAARHDAAAQERFLATMESEARRMSRLVNDLLSLSRVEGGERIRPTGEVDLAALLRSVVGSLQPLAEESGVALRLSGADEICRLEGDSDQLSQVFTNLVENAVKYGAAGGRVEISVLESAREPALRGPAVRVSVRDHGEGFDPIHIPRLTERFYRIDAHRSREMGGTGLGLAIVKHIVGRHRGRLRIESTPGQGSEFTVILPLPAGCAS